MKNLERTEEEAIRSIESILNRMEELSIKTNKNNRKYKKDEGILNEEYHNKKQITLLNKNSGGYIYLHIPNIPTIFE